MSRAQGFRAWLAIVLLCFGGGLFGAPGPAPSAPPPAPVSTYTPPPPIELDDFLSCLAAETPSLRPVFENDPGKSEVFWRPFCDDAAPGARAAMPEAPESFVEPRFCCDRLGMLEHAGPPSPWR